MEFYLGLTDWPGLKFYLGSPVNDLSPVWVWDSRVFWECRRIETLKVPANKDKCSGLGWSVLRWRRWLVWTRSNLGMKRICLDYPLDLSLIHIFGLGRKQEKTHFGSKNVPSFVEGTKRLTRQLTSKRRLKKESFFKQVKYKL